MTLKEFKEIITELQTINADMKAVDEAMKKLEPDFSGFYITRFETLVTKTLQIAMKDTSDWIGYFIYELGYGKKYKKGSVTDNGKDVPLKTVEDLYNLLIKNI